MQWFIAIVKNNTEVAVSKQLEEIGIETQLIAREVISQWKDGRRVKRTEVQLKNHVLVHCTEKQRIEIVGLPDIRFFMVDHTKSKNGRSPIAVVADSEVAIIRILLAQDAIDVRFGMMNQPGLKVKVIRGPFVGIYGEVSRESNQKGILQISLGILNYANLPISMDDVVLV